MKSRFIPLIVVVLLVASCGTIATPEWSAEAQGTRAAQAETSAFQTSPAPTATPIPPTATRVPPTATLTATPIPPTVTPAPPTEAAAQPTIGQSTTATPTQAAAALTGDPANGQVLFNELQPEAGFACATCHRIDSEERLVGPGLLNISERATTRHLCAVVREIPIDASMSANVA